jgi:hypothetical protein
MSKRDKDRKALSKNLPARAGYGVGYAKPPAVSRFQPGRSGNPRGRPKGAKNKKPALNEERLKDIILAEACRTIKVRDGEKYVTVPIEGFQVIRRLGNPDLATDMKTAIVAQQILDPMPNPHRCARQGNLGRMPVQASHAASIDTRGVATGMVFFDHDHRQATLPAMQGG